MYNVVMIDGKVRECIDNNGKPNKYGTPKIFTLNEAKMYIKKHSYIGMTCNYEIIAI